MSKHQYAAILFSLLLFAGMIPLQGKESKPITISGLVRKPMTLSPDDLTRFATATVRINALTRAGDFRGVFNCTGVPLKELLLFAASGKEPGKYSKPIDLAVIATGRDGSRSLFSWGEIMYGQPGNFIVATAFSPVMPFHSCGRCHNDNKYKKRFAPLTRNVPMPSLVAAGDRWYDRAIEGIQSIEVVDCAPPSSEFKPNKPKSFSFTVEGEDVQKPITIRKLARLPRRRITAVQVGDGKGYHGYHTFEGISLAELLAANGVKLRPEESLVISASDGYRSLVSAGELLYGGGADRIIVADTMNGGPAGEKGGFITVMPDDLSADRWVKKLSSIRIVTPHSTGKLYIIGVGPGDTGLVSLQAVSRMGTVGAFVCTSDIAHRFSHYMAGKPVLFDPLESMLHYYMKTHPGVTGTDAQKAVDRIRTEGVSGIRKLLKDGKSVAFLDYGDPTVYGSWTYWLTDHFKGGEIEIIPGISAFNAGNAMIARNVAASGSAIITVPDGLRSNEKMLAAVAAHGDTLVIFVGLKEMSEIVPLLVKYYGKDAPAAIAYRAGYRADQRLIRTTLSGIVEVIKQHHEKFLGIVYLGDVLKDEYVRPKKTGKDPL